MSFVSQQRSGWTACGVLIVMVLAGCPGPSTPSVDVCHADRDCEPATGVCVAALDDEPIDQAALPLRCGALINEGQDQACCQAADQCARGICLLAGACAEPCVDASDCAASERCVEVYARADQAALQTLRACVPRVDLPSDVMVTETQLDDVLTTDAQGAVIDLPAIEGASVIVMEHRSESLWPMTVECRTPLCVERLATADASPTLLFDGNAIGPGLPSPLNTVNTSADSFVSTILLPNGPRAVLSDRGYQVTLRSESAGDLAITRIERSTRGSRLDLHLHYVGAAGLRPEGTRGPPLVADALEHVEDVLAQAGIEIGNVCQTAVVGALAERLSTIDPPRFGLLVELPELFALSAGARGSALHVFLVDQVDVALGVSGGLPGPPGMSGTGSSGVVMSVALIDNPTQLGHALAHEIGHYLGLFHSIERDDTVLDPLPDTPRDSSNLMFWSGTASAQLSDQQCDVIAQSPLLR